VPPRDWRLRIEDVRDGADAIAKFVESADFDTFSRDRKTVDAVVILGTGCRPISRTYCQS